MLDQFSSVQLLSRVRLFATPWTTARQASLSITNSRSPPKPMFIGDAIQPSHPLSSPSPPALNLSQHQGLFKWVSSSHQVSKILEFQLYSCHLLLDLFQFALIHGPNIPGSYAILLFTASNLASITSLIHNWVLFFLWLHPFIFSVLQSFLLSSNTPLYEYTTFYLSIHSWFVGHLGYFHFLAIINNAALNITICFCTNTCFHLS